MRRMVPIWRSQAPPKCEAWGGFQIHSHPWLVTLCWSISLRASPSSDFAPTKLVPLSHLRMETGPRNAKNLLRAQMKELASMDSNSSMWIARLLRQVNTSPQRLELAALPCVFRERIYQGPKTSKPTFVKGGATSILSAGRSAIRCSIAVPLNFLHVTHVLSSRVTVLWPPINQNPAWRMAPCLI